MLSSFVVASPPASHWAPGFGTEHALQHMDRTQLWCSVRSRIRNLRGCQSVRGSDADKLAVVSMAVVDIVLPTPAG